ncbi:alpha/beta fold hydrolase [Jiangella rhizosphaerae]|uniref:Alpha/beta fold hydrolase n=1 Tax=Jiangella rhizosphaerae TaxID=2293569 RepID=A0A418KSM4_9ACTN|nr:alpha/beta fold hydrolase [Jiangella rhizosphaerae]
MGGLVLRDHWFDAPLDHAAGPGGETIRLYAREVVSAADPDRDRPWLLFLQGGPGGKATRPAGASGWVGRAVKDFRVLLLDQRGTGRSTPATAATLARRGDAAAQAEYLAHFRADAIVADAELIRRRLVGDDGRWHVLGQSYGGFCSLTYLSFAPEGLASVMLTGGLAPVAVGADDVYAATYRTVERKNEQFHAAFPWARSRLEEVAAFVRANDVVLPDGSRLTVPRLQALGHGLGANSAIPGLAYLLEEAFAADGVLSDTFLVGAWQALSFASQPLYAVLHEACYAHEASTRWSAQRVGAGLPQFAPDADPLLLTGEMIYPWMFEHDPALVPLRETAQLLAERSWGPLYDLDRLAANEVPVAAALYTEDMYVDAGLSRDTVSRVLGLRAWETNAHEHDGLRETEDVVDRLIRMNRGEL